MRSGGATLHLHIGRNKSGSTTLQNHFVQHSDAMRQKGVRYALFGQPVPAGSAVPTFPTHLHLADFVRAQPGGAVLVSHEGLCCFTPEMTRIMASDLAHLNVQLILYVRPYGDWTMSSYNFDVRVGANGRDFDRYLETIRPSISFWPALEIWAQAIGWDRVRVRSLHAADLQGGDLLTDCLSAIGLPPAPCAQASRSNVSPGWIVIELLRMAVGRDSAEGWDSTGLAVAEAMHELAEKAVTATGQAAARVGYLTGCQAEELSALYNQDLARVAAQTGVPLQPDDPREAIVRLVLPSADQVPKPVIHLIRQYALEPEYARVHPEIAAFVSSCSFIRLCSA